MSDIPFLTGIHVTSFRNGHIHAKPRLRHALCMRKQGKAVVMVGMPDASAALSGRKGLKIYTY